MDARIRPVERRDALALAALRIQQDREAGHTPRDGFLTDYADAFLHDFDRYRGWIAELPDGDPVGALLAQRIRTLPTLSDQRPEWWSVQDVFVTSNHRRHGVGAGLVAAVQRAGRDSSVRWLELRTSDRGRALFEACGFSPASARVMRWTPWGST